MFSKTKVRLRSFTESIVLSPIKIIPEEIAKSEKRSSDITGERKEHTLQGAGGQRRKQGSDAKEVMKCRFLKDTRRPQTKLGERSSFAVNVMVSHTFAFHVSMESITHRFSEILGNKFNTSIVYYSKL